MYAFFTILVVCASVQTTIFSMEQSRVSTPEIVRRRLASIQQKLNTLGRKFVHVLGTDKEDGVKKEMTNLEQEKEQLQQKLGISSEDIDEESGPGTRKISVQQKVDTLRIVLSQDPEARSCLPCASVIDIRQATEAVWPLRIRRC